MSSNPVLYPMGKAALDWILSGGRPQRGSKFLGLAYRWQAFWFDQNLKAVDSRCSETNLSPPVFVLGMWRSGTTFLHELLAAHETLVAPTTWQCMNSSIHLLHPPPPNREYVVRPMDSFLVGAESPQEDEFALLAQGVPSVYLGFFDPRRLQELERWLDPEFWPEFSRDRWWTRWQLFLKSVQHGHSGRLLLKSPNHTFRIRAIVENMPEASFIWVLRDPADVFFSNLKMWKAMIERYALWDVDPEVVNGQMQSFLAAALRYSSEALLYALNALQPARLAVVQYEHAISRPREILARIHDHLRTAPDEVKDEQLNNLIGRAASFPKTTYSRSLPDVLQPAIETLAATYRTAYASHGI